MAIYDYKCKECENTQEVRHGMTESPKIDCLICGSSNTFKMVGAARTIFKGGGWAAKELALDRIGMPEHVKKHARTNKALD